MICIHCGGPGPCDCWKLRLTPQEREEAQAAIMAKWVVKHDRMAFERRQAEGRLYDERHGNRGQFGIIRRRGRQKETVMTRIASVALVLMLVSGLGVASAQTPTPVPSPTPPSTRLQFDHDGVNIETGGYKLQVDGGEKVIVAASCAVLNAVRTCDIPFPALTPGNHSLVVIAWNVSGEAASDPFLVSVVVVPMKPAGLRIVIKGDRP